jgi:signal peptidase
VVRQEPVYSSGDIITFSDPQGEQFTTHRVVTRIDSDTYFKTLSYMTKGDANNAPDLTPIPAGDVIGRTVLVIPYLGFLNSFVRSQAGFVVFILIPGAFIIAGELRSIMGEVKTIAGSQRSSKRETDDEPAIPIPRVELRTT